MKKWFVSLLVGALVVVIGSGSALAQSGGTFNLRTTTLDAGGGTSTGGAFTLSGTVGQHDANPTSTSGGMFTVIGGFWQGALSALEVTLNSFEAQCRPDENDILLLWETATENDLLGFNLYRATSETGAPSQINEALILSQSPGGGQGASYTYPDSTVEATNTYYYWLETVDMNGATQQFGPISSPFPCTPTAVTLGGFSTAPNQRWRAIILIAGLSGAVVVVRRVIRE